MPTAPVNPSDPTVNPYSRGYAAIWAAFNAWPQWVALVKPGNQINMQTPGYQPTAPNKSQPADRSFVRLSERRLGIVPFKWNATGVLIPAVYSLEIMSGKYGPDAMNLLSVECCRALVAIDSKSLLGIGDILQDWTILDATATPRDPMSGRPEWSSIFSLKLIYAMNRAAFMSASFTI